MAQAKMVVVLKDLPKVRALIAEQKEEIRLLRRVIRSMFDGAQESGATQLMIAGTSEDIEGMKDVVERALGEEPEPGAYGPTWQFPSEPVTTEIEHAGGVGSL